MNSVPANQGMVSPLIQPTQFSAKNAYAAGPLGDMGHAGSGKIVLCVGKISYWLLKLNQIFTKEAMFPAEEPQKVYEGNYI